MKKLLALIIISIASIITVNSITNASDQSSSTSLDQLHKQALQKRGYRLSWTYYYTNNKPSLPFVEHGKIIYTTTTTQVCIDSETPNPICTPDKESIQSHIADLQATLNALTNLLNDNDLTCPDIPSITTSIKNTADKIALATKLSQTSTKTQVCKPITTQSFAILSKEVITIKGKAIIRYVNVLPNTGVSIY